MQRAPVSEASVYIHVPFCTVLCPFCDFYKRSFDTGAEAAFVNALCQEIDCYKQERPIKVPTLFFGGGTPSVLSAQSFSRILNALSTTFDLSGLQEFSIEANPEDINKEFCDCLTELGLTRLSLGVQSFSDHQCRFLGRGHSGADSHRALELLSNYDFVVSLDLMFAMPELSMLTLQHSLEAGFSYPIHHLSTYCLTIEPHTVFYKKGVQTVGSDKEREQYQFIREFSKQRGFEQYEVSNFAKPGFHCLHNKRYWQYENYIGLGPSAHSLLYPYRFHNTATFKGYVTEPRPAYFDTNLKPQSFDTLLEEHVLAAFRLREGLTAKRFKDRHGVDIFKQFESAIHSAKTKGLLIQSESAIRSTDEGLMLLDELVMEFMS